ncbi:cobyrinate a,c-diamide synthase [Janibacter terrae]|uniref:Hydrogenobyrinate a,c-diamide synthase n=1 Tax=Janibacter terrae TaxID=103817 RepID=A0ABZ2FDZ6_9MICO|nr:cobyrinate a,c-diamide synthase [Janibacter terrae]MBA4083607.1 cobyrinate a,c-diamide synthase [Kytococcus sp.]HBO55350.1 cobyrinate a,c-diamide synthase [Janibacter terrae]
MTTLPRVLVAAPASGHGKTTIAVGIMAALARRGLTVAPAKVGPDYIDPGYHALATGRPSRTLDPWLVGEGRVAPLLARGATHPTLADVAVLEGVMGLMDGRLGGDGFASSAHVATLTRTPVVLVVDISSTSRTVAATVHGLATIDPELDVVGVVLNKAGTPRHGEEARRAVEAVGVPVWGVLPRDAAMHVPSRHLGLVPAAERGEAAATLDHIAAVAEEHLDLDALLAASRTAPDLDLEPWAPGAALPSLQSPLPEERAVHSSRREVVVAVAGGRAFTFRYPETVELLEAAGARVVELDPARDAALPEDTSGLYLGGGFPEVHARTLATNRPLVHQIRTAIAAGMPTIAECAGMLYLAETLDDHPMVGALPARAAMGRRLTLGYREATSLVDSVLGPAGTRVAGHEFHRTVTDPPFGTSAAWDLGGRTEGFALDPAGTGRATLVASYLHTHWAGSPSVAGSFVEAARGWGQARTVTSDEVPRGVRGSGGVALGASPVHPTSAEHSPDAPQPAQPLSRATPARSTSLADPLRHHGDAEVSSELVDLAVNVRLTQPPGWLAQALAEELSTVAAYPDPTRARDAIAARHGVARDQVLPTSGGAEAFTLLARALTPRDAVVVHPQFTEPEAALRAAGHEVRRVLLRPEDDFALTAQALGQIGDADLVVVGNPTNPTGVLHPAATLRSLVRPGRVVLVDEAFIDSVPGERETLLGGDLTGLLVVRSLTKTWAVAGIRAGYVVGDAELVAALAEHQPHWSVGSLALRVMIETATQAALVEADRAAEEIAGWRAHLTRGLHTLGIPTAGGDAPFVLARVGTGVREALRDAGWAVRRGDTFPGLDTAWVRIAVRDPHTIDGLLRELTHLHHRRTA